MAKFRVRKTFELQDQRVYVLAGSIVEGEIRPGMWIDFTSGVSWRRGPITSVEFHKGSSEGEVWLKFGCSDLQFAQWRLMTIGEDLMNVFDPPTMLAGMD